MRYKKVDNDKKNKGSLLELSLGRHVRGSTGKGMQARAGEACAFYPCCNECVCCTGRADCGTVRGFSEGGRSFYDKTK